MGKIAKQEKKIKIVLVGPKNVGKTALSLCLRTNADATQKEIKNTVGADMATETYAINNKQCNVMLWDIGGQSNMLQIKPVIGPADAIVFCFDASQADKLDETKKTYQAFTKDLPESVAIIFMATKKDLLSADKQFNQPIRDNVRKTFSNDADVLVTSAKTCEGVENAFIHVIRKVLLKRGNAKGVEITEPFEGRMTNYLQQQIERIEKSETKEKTNWLSRFMNWIMTPLLKRYRKGKQTTSKQQQFQNLFDKIDKPSPEVSAQLVLSKTEASSASSVNLSPLEDNKQVYQEEIDWQTRMQQTANIAKIHRHQKSHWKFWFRRAKQQPQSLKDFQQEFSDHMITHSLGAK